MNKIEEYVAKIKQDIRTTLNPLLPEQENGENKIMGINSILKWPIDKKQVVTEGVAIDIYFKSRLYHISTILVPGLEYQKQNLDENIEQFLNETLSADKEQLDKVKEGYLDLTLFSAVTTSGLTGNPDKNLIAYGHTLALTIPEIMNALKIKKLNEGHKEQNQVYGERWLLSDVKVLPKGKTSNVEDLPHRTGEDRYLPRT